MEHSFFFKNITKPRFIDIIKYLNNKDVQYFASSGTLLGAIRHKGIIPWDYDCDIGIQSSELDNLIQKINSLDGYYLWARENEKQIKSNAITSIEQFKNLKHKEGLYLTADDNRTVCDVEIWDIYDRNVGGEAWSIKFDKNYSKFFCPNSWFSQCKKGGFNIPLDLAFPLKKVKFYDTYINVFSDSETYLKMRYDEECLTHGPDKDRFCTDNTLPLTDFSPL